VTIIIIILYSTQAKPSGGMIWVPSIFKVLRTNPLQLVTFLASSPSIAGCSTRGIPKQVPFTSSKQQSWVCFAHTIHCISFNINTTISRTTKQEGAAGHLKPDHGKNFLPGAEAAPDNQAPQPLDHFKRGYKERADLRDREFNLLSADHEILSLSRAVPPLNTGYGNTNEGGYNSHDRRSFNGGGSVGFDVMRLVDELCRPGCILPHVLERARGENVASFASGKALTAILSNLARRRKIGIALSVWQWMDAASIKKNVFHYNSLISVCEKMKDNKRALRLMDEMGEKGIPKNEVT
jgi:pentatricopeptide repeat protein